MEHSVLEPGPMHEGPQPACCSTKNYIKYIRTHGRTAEPSGGRPTTFKVPEGYNIITMTPPGKVLCVHPAIKDDIFEVYKNGGTMFRENDSHKRLTEPGRDLVITYKKLGTKLQMVNHTSGMVMNDFVMFFTSEDCGEGVDDSCKLFCFDKNKPEEDSLWKRGNPHKTIVCTPEILNRKTGTHTELSWGVMLSELIIQQGPGTYIVNSCRGFSEGMTPDLEDAAREVSRRNEPYAGVQSEN